MRSYENLKLTFNLRPKLVIKSKAAEKREPLKPCVTFQHNGDSSQLFKKKCVYPMETK